MDNMTMMFLVGIMPMILFVIIDYYTSAKNAIFAAVLTSSLFGVISYFILDDFIYESVFIVVAMIVMGTIAVKLKNSVYFKMQPVVTNIGLVLFLSYFQIFDEPFIFKVIPKMTKYLPENKLALLETAAVQDMLSRITVFLIIWVIFHSIVVGFAALRLSNTAWIILRSAGIPFTLIGVLATEFAYKQLFF